MGAVPPYRLALQLSGADSGSGWLAAVRQAEAAGWDVVSLPDHLDAQFAPLVGLAAAAAVTERVRLGTFVLVSSWRHVAMLAKELATLDVVSGGRVEAGIGGGWNAPEFAALGQRFAPAAERIAVVAEAVDVLRALWRGETLDLAGPHFSGTAVRCLPLPAQPGGPPVVMGGGGRRMLELAGRSSDIVSLIPSNAGRTVAWSLPAGLDRASVATQIGWVAAAAGAAGRATPQLNIRLLGVAPGADPLEAARRLAADRGAETARTLVGSPYLLLGRPQDMAEQMEETRQVLGVAYYTASARDAAVVLEAAALARGAS